MQVREWPVAALAPPGDLSARECQLARGVLFRCAVGRSVRHLKPRGRGAVRDAPECAGRGSRLVAQHPRQQRCRHHHGLGRESRGGGHPGHVREPRRQQVERQGL
eukprot:5161758-Pyramimonas_sp.AAC.1